MKVAIFGSRDGVDKDIVVNYLRRRFNPDVTLVSGGARGVDSFAEQAWQSLGGHIISLRPVKLGDESWSVERWETETGLVYTPDEYLSFEDFNSAACYRNMLIAAEADRGVAFRHKGSRGTGHTIGFFASEGKPCSEHEC